MRLIDKKLDKVKEAYCTILFEWTLNLHTSEYDGALRNIGSVHPLHLEKALWY